MAHPSRRQARKASHARNRPQAQASDDAVRGRWLMYLVAVVTLICASCMLFLIAQAVYSGVAVSMSRGGPSVIYPLVTRPLGFYLHLLLYSASAALFLGFTWLCLRGSSHTR